MLLFIRSHISQIRHTLQTSNHCSLDLLLKSFTDLVISYLPDYFRVIFSCVLKPLLPKASICSVCQVRWIFVLKVCSRGSIGGFCRSAKLHRWTGCEWDKREPSQIRFLLNSPVCNIRQKMPNLFLVFKVSICNIGQKKTAWRNVEFSRLNKICSSD